MELKLKKYCWARNSIWITPLETMEGKNFKHNFPLNFPLNELKIFPSWGHVESSGVSFPSNSLDAFSQNYPQIKLWKSFPDLLVQKRETHACKPTQLGMGQRETSRRKKKGISQSRTLISIPQNMFVPVLVSEAQRSFRKNFVKPTKYLLKLWVRSDCSLMSRTPKINSRVQKNGCQP